MEKTAIQSLKKETLNINRLLSLLLIDELVKEGVQDFYQSPGMRNAPLLWAVKKHPSAIAYSGRDERSQGFRALGSTKKSGRPSVLLCTSGSALSHYYPAIIEAQKTSHPLIVISADRPFEMTQWNANQTINQNNLYAPYIEQTLSIPFPEETIPPKKLRAMVRNYLQRTSSGESAHINLGFRPPLGDGPSPISDLYFKQAMDGLLNDSFNSHSGLTTTQFSNTQCEILEKAVENSMRPLLVIGELKESTQKASLRTLIEALSIPYYLDITSGLKFEYHQEEGSIAGLDHPEVYKRVQEYNPDLILHIGGKVTSKYYEFILDELKELTLIQITSKRDFYDPSLNTDQRMVTDISQAGSLLKDTFQKYKKEGLIKWSDLIEQKAAIIDDSPLSYPVLSKKSVELLPDSTEIFIGNSTFIRSFDSYGSLSLKKKLHCFSNRGASGIEGLLSSAIGIAEKNKRPLVLFIGDISLFHDLNALQVLKESSVPLLVVMANNGQGGIFNLLPIQNDKELIDELTTPLNLNWNALFEAFDLSSKEVKTPLEYEQELKKWITHPKTQIFNALIDDRENQKLYQKLKTIRPYP